MSGVFLDRVNLSLSRSGMTLTRRANETQIIVPVNSRFN